MEDIVERGIIEPTELNQLMQDKKAKLSVLDATFVLPGSDQDPFKNFQSRHIKTARFFDITNIADHDSDLPNMLPSTDDFETHVSKLGVNNDDLIVIYGQDGMVKGPARAWWMFRCFSHKNVAVLNGGLPAWISEGFEITDEKPKDLPSSFFEANFNPDLVRDQNDMIRASNDENVLILDARPPERFSGQSEEPREGMRSGHIPSSKNLPCSSLADSQTGKIKPKHELEQLLSAQGYTENRPTITTCGSGVTACMIVLALHNMGVKDIPVYDGAWSEWGLESKSLPVEQITPKNET